MLTPQTKTASCTVSLTSVCLSLAAENCWKLWSLMFKCSSSFFKVALSLWVFRLLQGCSWGLHLFWHISGWWVHYIRWAFDGWKWDNYTLSKRQAPISQQYRAIFQKIGVLGSSSTIDTDKHEGKMNFWGGGISNCQVVLSHLMLCLKEILQFWVGYLELNTFVLSC